MTNLPKIGDLAYNLPKTKREIFLFFSKTLDIPYLYFSGAGQKEIDAVCSTVMYRHLDRFQKIKAMELIKSLKNHYLVSKLIAKVLDTSYINPQWGLWSLTNKELLEDERFHQIISNYAGYIGLSASGLGAKDIIKEVFKQKEVGVSTLVFLVIWGVVGVNQSSLNATENELNLRRNLKDSPFYR